MELAENCQVCLHPITNPICSDCYLKHIENWLVSQGMHSIERSIVLSKIRKMLPEDGANPHLCVSCLVEHLSLCSYCFFFKAQNILEELNFSEEFLETFEEIFSYLRDEQWEMES